MVYGGVMVLTVTVVAIALKGLVEVAGGFNRKK
jgi:hypothetical protein